MLETRLISTTEQFDELQDQWEELQNNTNTSFFMTFDWMRTWWTHYGDENFELFIFTFFCKDINEIVGIAPFVIQRETGPFGLPTSKLRFLGTGEDQESEACSEILDIIAMFPYENEIAQSLVFHLNQMRNHFDVMFFQEIMQNTFISRYLVAEMSKQGFETEITYSHWADYFIDLPSTVEEYLNTLRKSMKKKLPKEDRRAYRLGEITIQRVQDPDEIEEMLLELKRLHELRWNQQGLDGAFAKQVFMDFHQELIQKALPKNQVLLNNIAVDGVNFASFYGFRYNTDVYFYQTGMDTSVFNSGGTVSIFDAIKQSIANGDRIFSFLKAEDSDTYKKDTYNCKSSPIYEVTSYTSKIHKYAAHLNKDFRSVARRVRDKIRKRNKNANIG